MGWFGSGNSPPDPLRRLDPQLREFLKKESPIKYDLPDQESTQPPPSLPTSRIAQQSGAETHAPTVPQQSLYQDGRYAYLWKTYRPLVEIENEGKTEHDKLMDVLEAYKERKEQIGRAALENCAFEQLDWRQCMQNPDWTSRLTMCRAEVRKFEKCFKMQSRLLKALGYLSTYDRPSEVDEQIQMHADALFQRMQEQEAAIDKAKSEGLPIPSFPPLVGRPDEAEPPPNEAVAKAWKERLEKVPEGEREAEQEALRAEHRAKDQLVAELGTWNDNRRIRREQGKDTWGDKFAGFFGR